MTRTIPWDEEHAAGEALVAHRRGRWERRDVGGAPDSTYDLHVIADDGTEIALEVTQDTTSSIRGQHAAEAKRNWSTERFEGFWDVGVVEPVDVRRTHQQIFRLVEQLSTSGRHQLVLGSERPSDSLLAEFHELGVRTVVRVAAQSPGHVNLSPASQGGSFSSNNLVEVVEHHANLADNSKKLSRADVDERHLWVWVTVDRGMHLAALLDDRLPNIDPEIPSHIDCVWVAPAVVNPIVWRWCRSRGWQRFDRSEGAD